MRDESEEICIWFDDQRSCGGSVSSVSVSVAPRSFAPEKRLRRRDSDKTNYIRPRGASPGGSPTSVIRTPAFAQGQLFGPPPFTGDGGKSYAAKHTKQVNEQARLDRSVPPSKKGETTKSIPTGKNETLLKPPQEQGSLPANGTYLAHLNVGDVGCHRDMMEDADEDEIDSLQVHDFAFIKRSDQRRTYALVALRPPDRILFLVDGEGSTKMLSRRHWFSCVRLVNNDVTDDTSDTDSESGDSLSSSESNVTV